MTTKLPDGRKIVQIVIKYTNIFHHKIYPNWEFWYENIPSGKPVLNSKKIAFSRQLMYPIVFILNSLLARNCLDNYFISEQWREGLL
jgi:hypothetical protein